MKLPQSISNQASQIYFMKCSLERKKADFLQTSNFERSQLEKIHDLMKSTLKIAKRLYDVINIKQDFIAKIVFNDS